MVMSRVMELPVSLRAVGACYAICWERDGDEITPQTMYGSHLFLQVCKLDMQQGDEVISLLMDSTCSNFQPASVKVIDTGSANPLEFQRKQAAVTHGIGTVLLALCWADGVLELGFEYLECQVKESLDAISRSVAEWTASVRSFFCKVGTLSLKQLPRSVSGDSLPLSQVGTFDDSAEGHDRPLTSDGMSSVTDVAKDADPGLPGLVCKHFVRASGCTEDQPCFQCRHCERMASGEPCLFCPLVEATPPRSSTWPGTTMSMHGAFAKQWLAKNCWRPQSCNYDTPGCNCHSCTLYSGAWSPEANLLNEACPSRGSIGHPFTCNSACKFIRRGRGCGQGTDCNHCHICNFSRWGARQERRARG